LLFVDGLCGPTHSGLMRGDPLESFESRFFSGLDPLCRCFVVFLRIFGREPSFRLCGLFIADYISSSGLRHVCTGLNCDGGVW